MRETCSRVQTFFAGKFVRGGGIGGDDWLVARS